MNLPGNLRRILLVRTDNLGDVVLLGPAAEAVRRSYPDARITLLASQGGAAAAPLLRGVDDVIAHRAVWQELEAGRESAAAELALIDEIRARGLDAAIVFTSFSQSGLPAAMLCYLAGIPVRAGYAERFAGRVLTHAVLPPAGVRHEAERNLDLVRGLGCASAPVSLSISVPEAAQWAADRALESLRIAPSFVLIAPGASAPARRYPAERFREVAARLADGGRHVLVTGSDRERALLEAVVGDHDDPRICGIVPADPAMLAGLVRRAGAVVTNNSLTMHLADASGVPCVVLYAGTDLPQHWAPRRVPHRLLNRPTACSPCWGIHCARSLECLDVAPAEVVSALDTLLAASPPYAVPA